MKGNAQVIAKLNELLAGELSAMDQYFIHSRMYDDWGLKKLYERIDHEFEDEKGHASKLIERILFLGGTPDMVTRVPLNIGKDVPAMLDDLQRQLQQEGRDISITLHPPVGLEPEVADAISQVVVRQLQ